MDAGIAERLAGAHLDVLWYADGDGGCCPKCCNPCSALRRLLDAGQLDDIVRDYAPGSDWWNASAGRIDRAWLAVAWRMTDCHSGDRDG